MVRKVTVRLILFLTFMALLVHQGMAQEGTVRGMVFDAEDGTGLPGASILIKGTATGTTTDIEGKFSLTVEPNTVLVISYVGYLTREVTVQPNSTVEVSLQIDAEMLDEFVVIGYGIQKKDDATGSVNAIESRNFNQGAVITPAELISGKVAGVQVVNSGGAPGAATTIRIRGGSSLQALNDPLIVIDGVPVDNEGISGSRNALSSINPNDIESMTVLKDASATAIYGSRASNGVIIITTKKSRLGETDKRFPVKIEYSGKFSLNTPTRTLGVYEADEYRGLIADRHPNRVGMLGNYNTDWQDEIFNNAFGMEHYISASGAVSVLPYRFSIGYSDQDGILKTDNLQRTTLALNLSPTLLGDKLKVNVNTKYDNSKNKFADNGAIAAAVQYDPTQPTVIDDERFGGYYYWAQVNGNPVELATRNPLAMLMQRSDRSTVHRFLGNAQFDYRLHFLPELRANLNLAGDFSSSDGNIFVDTTAAFEYDPLYGGGVDNYYRQEKQNQLLEFYLNYDKHLVKLNSKINALMGYSWQHFYRSNYTINSNVARTPELTDTIDDPTEYYLLSYFGRINYTFRERYLLTFTLRNDNTSRFSKENRSGWFPSVAFAWKINEEGFMDRVDFISQLKLRLSYGITGQQNINQGDYPYLARYTYNRAGAYYLIGNTYYRTLRPEGYDENIKWEETSTYNIGIDYGFADDRFYGSIDFYYRQTKDLLNIVPVPAGTNLTNEILTNIGNLENKGVEFSIFTRPIVQTDFSWELGANFTYNQNEITQLTASDDPNYPGYKVGGISGGVGNTVQIHSVGFPAFSYYVYEQVYDADGKPIQGMYVDRNGDGEITDDDRYHYKDPNPDVILGLNSMFRYRNLDFSFSGRAYFGNYIYNNVESENAVYERLYRPEGPYLSNITTEVTETDFVNPQYLSDYYIQDGSFFKMDYMTLGYNFMEVGEQKFNVRLSFTVTNAFIISKYRGLDPERFGGIDNNIYPRPRAYVLGVSLTF
jgi:TonB-dependent starch-binding outer membrane protein SusC